MYICGYSTTDIVYVYSTTGMVYGCSIPLRYSVRVYSTNGMMYEYSTTLVFSQIYSVRVYTIWFYKWRIAYGWLVHWCESLHLRLFVAASPLNIYILAACVAAIED